MKGILISGKMLSGKDHVAQHITKQAQAHGLQVYRFGWADALKGDASGMLSGVLARPVSVNDIERDKVVYRPFLQGYGRTMRLMDPEHWVKRAHQRIDQVNHLDSLAGRAGKTLWVNADTRFPNELLAKEWGFISIRLKVTRPNQLERMFRRDGKIDETSLYDISETALDETEARGQGDGVHRFDHILEDMPLEDLYREIDRILEGRGLLSPLRGGPAEKQL